LWNFRAAYAFICGCGAENPIKSTVLSQKPYCKAGQAAPI
jgi:hypothetical protein